MYFDQLDPNICYSKGQLVRKPYGKMFKNFLAEIFH